MSVLKSFLNFSTTKVGRIRFVKVGRLCVSFCITNGYTPCKGRAQEGA